jgi:hypothetical protein
MPQTAHITTNNQHKLHTAHSYDMTETKSLAQDLFEDMGRKVAEASAQESDEDGPTVVDEIESLCMNCHENVGWLP